MTRTDFIAGSLELSIRGARRPLESDVSDLTQFKVFHTVIDRRRDAIAKTDPLRNGGEIRSNRESYFSERRTATAGRGGGGGKL